MISLREASAKVFKFGQDFTKCQCKPKANVEPTNIFVVNQIKAERKATGVMGDLNASTKTGILSSGVSYSPLLEDKPRCIFKQRIYCVLFLTVILCVVVIICLEYERPHYQNTEDTDASHVLARVIYYDAGIIESNAGLRLICYYTFPSASQPNALKPEQLDPHLCTHINVGFARISNNSLYLTDDELAVFKAVTALKIKNPNLKVLVSIGGAGTESGYPQMVINHKNRKDYKCDGIDLDWEFPNKVPSKDDKQRMHFTQLLYELRKEINRQVRHKFLVSVAVAAPKFLVDLSYDVTYMNNYVDFVNVMTYDFNFYTRLTPITGFNSPLFSSDTRNINYSASYWVECGMDKEKINIGMPTYGHTFELFNDHNNGVGAPARGYGHLGSNGFTSWNEICSFFMKNPDVCVVFDNFTKAAYAYKGTEWISFDDEISLVYKAEYVLAEGFGGAMVYSLNADDYIGQCGNQSGLRFPLTNQIKLILK